MVRNWAYDTGYSPRVHNSLQGIMSTLWTQNSRCAYSEAYSCPFVPVGNWLEVLIPAGEKDYLLGKRTLRVGDKK
ncbi:DUF1684 domain-containing protein [Candidatus Bipolaricaulota bacterium]|nr:DUF1684 domain-containing protein [Candidatus Bipolaricaulota bacterium]